MIARKHNYYTDNRPMTIRRLLRVHKLDTLQISAALQITEAQVWKALGKSDHEQTKAIAEANDPVRSTDHFANTGNMVDDGFPGDFERM